MTEQVPRRALVTSGPTRAYFDRIRYIANTSSGALGDAVVQALLARGMSVTHIVGEGAVGSLTESSDMLDVVRIATVDDLIGAVNHLKDTNTVDSVVHAMAVLDYAPKATEQGKKKSGAESWNVELVRTPKVIRMFRGLFPEAFLVGFKLETNISEQELIARASTLISVNQLDLAIANDIDRITAEHHDALFVRPDGSIIGRPSTKTDIADCLADIIQEHTE